MVCSFDPGTHGLVFCRRDDKGDFTFRREINAFIELPLENRFVFNMMKTAGVPLIEREKVAYALGEAACDMAYTMNQIELKRPMAHGCVNPKEKDAFQIMSIMMHSLMDIKKDGEVLYYCVPENAINQETDADYHQRIIEAIFKAYKNESGYKVEAHPINEALALIYAELGKKAYTGIGISCLCEGTKIYTKDGIIPIENVQKGDMVLTHKGRWRKVNNVIKQKYEGVATKLQITGYSNKIDDYKFVKNHELYVNRDNNWQWVGCEEVKKGDIVGEPFELADSNLTKMVINISERKTCSKNCTKKSISVTADVQRLIGYFLADGSVNLSENSIQFDFGINENKNIEDVQEILRKNFHKESSLTKHGENCTRVKCYSTALAKYFAKHFYDKNKLKIYPWDLEKLTKSDCISLLAGLIRGDGVVGEYGVSFYNTNTRLIHLAKRLFAKIGIPASVYYREPRIGKPLADGRIISGKKPEWKVNCGSKTTLKSILQIIEEINCNNSNYRERLFILNNFCCGRIKKIDKENYCGNVYDLQVDEDYSFSGPMLTIKNCGGGMTNVCYAMYGNPVFKFSIVNSGDWIDKQAAKATGESVTFINREKTKIDFSKPPATLVERAIQTQYRLMIEHAVNGIKKGLTDISKTVRTDGAVDIVMAGGTSSPPGFVNLFKETMQQANLPIKIGEIIKPNDPLYAVSRGCLLAAEAAVK